MSSQLPILAQEKMPNSYCKLKSLAQRDAGQVAQHQKTLRGLLSPRMMPLARYRYPDGMWLTTQRA